MAQKLRDDKIGVLSQGAGVITLAASSSSPSWFTIGGQQYKVTSNLSRTILTDVTLTLQNLYHIYAVISGGSVVLRISTNVNSVGPSGFASWKLIGAFYTDTSAIFNAFVSTSGTSVSTVVALVSGSSTYITPTQATFLKIKMVGGGAGGNGSGGSGQGNGGVGTLTTFGTSLLTANGGTVNNSDQGGAGGTATIAGPAIGTAVSGGQGFAGGAINISGGRFLGGLGGNSPYFSGGGATSAFNQAGSPANANTGSGGQGGPTNAAASVIGGGGGGSGGFIDAIIYSPASSYPYSVGSGGTGGTAGTSGGTGGAGAAGVIRIEEGKPNLQDLKDL